MELGFSILFLHPFLNNICSVTNALSKVILVCISTAAISLFRTLFSSPFSSFNSAFFSLISILIVKAACKGANSTEMIRRRRESAKEAIAQGRRITMGKFVSAGNYAIGPECLRNIQE
jgi:hypothetical protein